MIQVCDAIMGTGKSSAAITYMNEHKEEKFIYITPYLEEAERIKNGCKSMHFVEPSDKLKSMDLRKASIPLLLLNKERISQPRIKHLSDIRRTCWMTSGNMAIASSLMKT